MKGHAERVPENELNLNDGSVFYLPHHHVVSEPKPGKIRVVFDCVAKSRGVSLNSTCFKGDDLANKLIDILLYFCQYCYVVMADVEACNVPASSCAVTWLQHPMFSLAGELLCCRISDDVTLIQRHILREFKHICPPRNCARLTRSRLKWTNQSRLVRGRHVANLYRRLMR